MTAPDCEFDQALVAGVRHDNREALDTLGAEHDPVEECPDAVYDRIDALVRAMEARYRKHTAGQAAVATVGCICHFCEYRREAFAILGRQS